MSSKTTERLGIAALETLFARAGWLFREQFVHDHGIDAQVEIAEEGQPTGQLIAIQSKSGERYFAESDENQITYRPDSKHVNYWLQHNLPVIVTLYQPVEKKIYWAPITDKTIEKTAKAYKITIPRADWLNDKNCKILKRVFKLKVPEYRMKRLLLDLDWMLLLKKGEVVYAEFEDWVNKSLSRTPIRLYCETSDENYKLIIPQHYWPGHDVFSILAMFLPWASFEMDEDGYEERMREEYETECYQRYDKETGETFYSEKFEDWYSPPDGIHPIYEDGEIARYRVTLKLNKLGEAFLTVARHLYSDHSFEYRAFSIDDI